MLRLLFWIALIAAAVWFWRKFKASSSTPKSPAEREAAPMVRCAHCGVHLPRDRALSLQPTVVLQPGSSRARQGFQWPLTRHPKWRPIKDYRAPPRN